MVVTRCHQQMATKHTTQELRLSMTFYNVEIYGT